MAGKIPYIGVVVYESSSSSPEYTTLYQEDFLLVYADSDQDAVDLVTELARRHEHTDRTDDGETVSLTLKSIIEVSTALTTDLSAGGPLYTRHFRDYDAYRRMEPLLGDSDAPGDTNG